MYAASKQRMKKQDSETAQQKDSEEEGTKEFKCTLI